MQSNYPLHLGSLSNIFILQLSGPGKEAVEYAEWIKEDSRFSDMLVQISPSPGGHAFPRLRLRYKPSLVQVCSPFFFGQKPSLCV